MMQKLIVALLGLSFAFAVTSCGEGKKKIKVAKASEKQIERHHDRW